jgi:hypothetical protein
MFGKSQFRILPGSKVLGITLQCCCEKLTLLSRTKCISPKYFFKKNENNCSSFIGTLLFFLTKVHLYEFLSFQLAWMWFDTKAIILIWKDSAAGAATYDVRWICSFHGANVMIFEIFSHINCRKVGHFWHKTLLICATKRS